MYLCKLLLDPNHADARRDLADAYEMHSSLARAMAPDAASAPPRFLWRLEQARSSPGMVLVQTPVRPDWSRLAGVQDHESIAFDPAALLKPGQVCRFRLRANPTVCRNGKRWGLGSEADQLAWLSRQGERGGFVVAGCVRTESGMVYTRQRKRGGHRITVQAAGFEGVLRVQDPARLAEVLVNGLGHAKAFGLGLLSLARG